MKFIIILYIALGLVLSVVIGIEYNFKGEEMMPKYWGSPFVYKQESLGSSLERYYSISGIILNVIIWSIMLFFIDKVIERIKKSPKFKTAYKALIVICITFTSLNVFWDYGLIGNGFEKSFNYWYWDIDREAQEWGGKYEGKLTTLKK
jgi:hypothetical protein